MTQFSIYKITNLINKKILFGQTVQEPSVRWAQYKWNWKKKHKNQHIYNAFSKYGIENFTFEVIDTNAKNMEQLNNLEIFYIEMWKTQDRNIGYNIQPGGLNKAMTEETKKKISDINRGRQTALGRKWTDEQRIKFSLATTGKKRSEEQKNNMKVARPSIAGIKNHNAKLTMIQVAEIIEEYKQGNITYKQLCKKYNVSYSTITKVLNGHSYKT